MNALGWVQIALYVAIVALLTKPMGVYMARVYEGQSLGIVSRVLGPFERVVYRVCGVRSDTGMTWKRYSASVLLISVFGIASLWIMQRLQGVLPLNPEHLGPPTHDSSFNTAVSFVTNTNWQGYGGETTMSYFTQMFALAVQNFLSAATGMAVAIALIRGLRGRQTDDIGNFWVDLTRSTLYILLPLSLLMAIALVSQGVVQTFSPYVHATLVEATHDSDNKTVLQQVLALGPAASQIAIKQLGTNGGGFFNANSAHPFENATAVANFIEMVAIFLIPAGLTYTFGRMVDDTRQGWTIFAAMLVMFLVAVVGAALAEHAGNPMFAQLGLDSTANMEGKEVRFGVANSTLFAAITTSASCGAVNAMHDSFTPLGGLVPMVLIQLGEVIFGGVGAGLYGMLAFAIIAIFIAGLMVGRTPEYLGKKIEAAEMKLAALVVLAPALAVLIGTAVAVAAEPGRATIFNPGAHGFSEVLYAFSSAANNNGSAFAGLGANTPFYNVALAIAMLIGRFVVIVAMLGIAGSIARKKYVPPSKGTLPTHGPLFMALLIGAVILVGTLTYVPSLALGPIVEHLEMVQ